LRDSIRIMSFNVRGSFRDATRKNAWRNRAELNVATIERYAPDVIGLQEAQRGNLTTYRRSLPRYVLIQGPRYGNAFPYDSNAILYDPEKLRPLDTGGFWLSETPEKHSRSWGTKVARSATWAVFALKNTNLSLFHLNTHLDHISAPARREGSKLIVEKISGISAHNNPVFLLTGDFNARPGSATHKSFTGSGFVDTFLAAGNQDDESANTFHAFEGKRYRDAHPGRGPRRIDWILLKDLQGRLRITSHTIIRDADESSGLYPSDHYPIVADISISACQEARQSPTTKAKGSPRQELPFAVRPSAEDSPAKPPEC
jgi:endonuclease/exonuclease/phosphatase family metal-dependent hydrolase